MKRMMVLMLILQGCSTFQLAQGSKKVIVDKISPNTITVNFCGNAYMSQKDAEKYALQRASLEALSMSCSHFTMVKKEDNSKLCALPPKMSGNRSYSSLPVEGPGSPASSDFVEPNVTLTVQCIANGEKIPEDAIDAEKFLQENFPGLENKGAPQDKNN